MATERITFPGAHGDKLAARLDRPAEGEPGAWALFAHCFTCSKDLKPVRHITEGLTRQGVAVLRFDFTGLGESEGDFAETSFSSNVEDLVAAGRFMERSYQAPDLLVGHSLGGAAAIHAAPPLESVKAVATIAAPADPAHILTRLGDAEEVAEEEGEAEVSIAGRPFPISRQLVRDLRRSRMEEAVGELGRPLLLLHSPEDRVVGIDNATRLYQMARDQRSFVSLDGADHLLLDEGDARYVGRVIAAWASRYLDREGSV